MNAGGVSPPSLLSRFTRHLVAMATSLNKSENKILLQLFFFPSSTHKALSCGEKFPKIGPVIWRYSTKYARFLAVSYQNKLFQFWSYWTEVHDIFPRYRGIIYPVNAHIEAAISHSVLECQSDERDEFAIFFTKLVAMATSIEILEK